MNELISKQEDSVLDPEEIEEQEAEESEADASTAADEKDSANEELGTLRAEVQALRELLAQKEKEQAEALRELDEFNRLFPEVPIRQVPDAVWEEMQKGIPLCAAYALYEKKSRMAEAHAEKINQRNASLSAGKAGVHTSGEYFTPDEVRAMSQKQVRQNYQKIVESMKSWG